MRNIIIPICILIILVYACGPKKVKYEDATKWYKDCIPHPGLHPGDYYAYDEICNEDCKNRTNADIDKSSPPKESAPDPGSSIYTIEASDLYAERIQKMSCITGCIEKMNQLASHVEGGYYSDGSYYAMCVNPFDNIHPTKDKYEQNKWQTDRDDCMQLTFENVPQTFWSRERNQVFFGKWLNSAKKYYRECLDEKGYYEGLQ